MRVSLSDEHLAFRDKFRGDLDGLDVDAVVAEYDKDPMQIQEMGREFVRRLGADGVGFGVGGPEAEGGRDRLAIEQWSFLACVDPLVTP